MINIVLPTSANDVSSKHRLPFYLAIEEWVAHSLPPAEYFFCWVVDPTVIFGRNQDPTREVDLEYCRDNGIQVYRRRSGGGCVYSDHGNVMISYIAPSADVEPTFAAYTAKIVDMLVSLGLKASATGRNDVVIDGQKVSGNAFYRLNGCSILHGTMLFSTDMQHMTHAITPSRAKLESNRVKSVQSRITTLDKYLDRWTVDDLKAYIERFFTTGEYVLTPKDLQEIKDIEARYYDLKWTFGQRGLLGTPYGQIRAKRHIDGVGEVRVTMQLSDGKISDTEITGDFFMLTDLDEAICNRIKGCTPTREALYKALEGIDLTQVIAGMQNDQLVDLMTSVPPIS